MSRPVCDVKLHSFMQTTAGTSPLPMRNEATAACVRPGLRPRTEDEPFCRRADSKEGFWDFRSWPSGWECGVGPRRYTEESYSWPSLSACGNLR